MSIRLIYITANPTVGLVAQHAGVDWVLVDLEYIGKSERQAKMDSVISNHTLADVVAMRAALDKSQLLVRVNPIGPWSRNEICDVIRAGADIVMLPFFKTKLEVLKFVELVESKAKTCILLETLEAIDSLDDILKIDGINYVHIGLNDIHIARGTTFMFEFLADGGIDRLAKKLKDAEKTFGFGGMARIGDLIPSAERILAEHFRVGSTGVILSRSFCHPSQAGVSESFCKEFVSQVVRVREQENWIKKQSPEFFEKNRLQVRREIYSVASQLRSKIPE